MIFAVSAQEPRSAGASTIVAFRMSNATYLNVITGDRDDETPLGESTAWTRQ